MPQPVSPDSFDLTMPNSRNNRANGRPSTAKPLVIVESPAKARTISAMLGPDFVVESSVGHIRDLPKRADEVPAAYRGEGWARLGVDVDNGFKPLYVISPEKQSVVSRLKQAVRQASEVYVATDEDREGYGDGLHQKLLRSRGRRHLERNEVALLIRGKGRCQRYFCCSSS